MRTYSMYRLPLFFSDEAFRFYLPAYLIADIDDVFEQADPVFHLTHGLTDESRNRRVNPRRYGERTWFDQARYKFAIFNRKQVVAIIAYLRLKQAQDEYARSDIDQALRNYWIERAGEDARL